jgi:ribose transport system permease protein
MTDVATRASLTPTRTPARLSGRRIAAKFGYAGFAVVLLVALLATDLVLNPARFQPAALGTTIGLAAPLLLAAMASTPAIISGRGGIDISVGPLMGVTNVVVVYLLVTRAQLTSPWVLVPAAVLLGAASGALNGVLVTVVRLQPIVATLGTYLIYAGLAPWLLPTPGGSVPTWLSQLAGNFSIVPVLVVGALWWALTRTSYYEHLMATGNDDRAGYAAGVPVTSVRLTAYVLSGAIAGVAGLSLSGLLGSADPTVGPTFTLTAVAAVALGGISLAGGIGGMTGAVIGAIDIFLLQTLFTYFNVSSFVLQIAYGAVLVLAIVLNTTVGKAVRGYALGVAR